jgi:excisionase family DNA binding protein
MAPPHVAAIARFLTVEEVAQLVRCEHRTVRRAIKRGELEAALIGGRWLVRPDAIDCWFESRRATVSSPATPQRPGRSGGAVRGEHPGSITRLKALEQS